MPRERKAGERIGHYVLVRLLGKGATGEVWVADVTHLQDQRVAIKFLHSTALYEFSEELFEREVEALIRVESTHIIGIRDRGVDDGQRYYVMNYVKGIHFDELLADPKLEVDLFFDAMIQVLQGLARIHAEGIVHRDLKPKNLLWSHLGHAIILDFGFCRIRDRSSLGVLRANEQLETRLADLGIHPKYFDPMILNNLDSLTSDLYAVGGLMDDALPTLQERLSADQQAGMHDLIRRLRDKTNTIRFAKADEVQAALRRIFDAFSDRPVSKEEMRLFLIPEISGLASGREFVRIPPGDNVPLPPDIKALLDHSAFQQLRRQPQLPLVELVFPGATHTRFEHSLGVYHNTVQYARRLIADARFRAIVREPQVRAAIVAALLHDVGHYPFSHLLEELHQPETFPKHISRTLALIGNTTPAGLGTCIQRIPELTASAVTEMLKDSAGVSFPPAVRLLRSFLSGPLDADKVDYLQRDSLHTGVPYGNAFDKARLIQSLCLNEEGDGLAIAEKGKAALVLLVHGRFVMFSEVYFHHAVRTAVAMFQRAAYDAFLGPTSRNPDAKAFIDSSYAQAIECLRTWDTPTSVRELAAALFGPNRKLYKRLRTYAEYRTPHELWQRIEPMTFQQRVALGNDLSRALAKATGHPMSDHHVLIDVPPNDKGADIDVELFYRDTDEWLELVKESPAIFTLQVDQYRRSVRKVRVLIHPDSAAQCTRVANIDKLIADVLP